MELHPQWISGFCAGEGCFHISINKNENSLTGYQVLPEFVVTQHERDIQILYALKAYFGSGVVRDSRGKKVGSQVKCFRMRDSKAMREKLIPFFEKNLLKTTKHINFLKFRDVLLMMETGKHLTQEGLDEIRKIRDTLSPDD